MSARQRQEALNRAYFEGRDARDANAPQNANPYKQGEWALHSPWDLGWRKRDNELRKAVSP